MYFMECCNERLGGVVITKSYALRGNAYSRVDA